MSEKALTTYLVPNATLALYHRDKIHLVLSLLLYPLLECYYAIYHRLPLFTLSSVVTSFIEVLSI